MNFRYLIIVFPFISCSSEDSKAIVDEIEITIRLNDAIDELDDAVEHTEKELP